MKLKKIVLQLFVCSMVHNAQHVNMQQNCSTSNTERIKQDSNYFFKERHHFDNILCIITLMQW